MGNAHHLRSGPSRDDGEQKHSLHYQSAIEEQNADRCLRFRSGKKQCCDDPREDEHASRTGEKSDALRKSASATEVLAKKSPQRCKAKQRQTKEAALHRALTLALTGGGSSAPYA